MTSVSNTEWRRRCGRRAATSLRSPGVHTIAKEEAATDVRKAKRQCGSCPPPAILLRAMLPSRHLIALCLGLVSSPVYAQVHQHAATTDAPANIQLRRSRWTQHPKSTAFSTMRSGNALRSRAKFTQQEPRRRAPLPSARRLRDALLTAEPADWCSRFRPASPMAWYWPPDTADSRPAAR